MNISIICLADERLAAAADCAEKCGLQVVTQTGDSDDYSLVFGRDDVRLRSNRANHGDVLVDFCAGSVAHRRRFGGGKGQLIARAIGLKSGVRSHVHDMTAGLGGDSFVLASLGCPVTMFERNPVVYALLADGLERARNHAREKDPELLDILDRIHLESADSIDWLQNIKAKPSVIYLDPMFPERKKSASVKKEMQAFHGLIGDDADAGDLLQAALQAAEYRVVVKRPRIAPEIPGAEPSYRLEAKSSRYDIYALKSLNALKTLDKIN